MLKMLVTLGTGFRALPWLCPELPVQLNGWSLRQPPVMHPGLHKVQREQDSSGRPTLSLSEKGPAVLFAHQCITCF